MLLRVLLLVWAGLSPEVAAAQVHEVPYDRLAQELDTRIDFETLPSQAEPGFNLNAPLRTPGARIGERFLGQAVAGSVHDVLEGSPVSPLVVRPGRPGQSLSVAAHRGFGSNALFPLGPAGFPAMQARGEGAVAVLFDRDQAAFGLLVHGDYANPLGNRASGSVTLSMHDRSGQQIAVHTIPLIPGITKIGMARDGGIPDIAGSTLVNDDPGGIAIDDILFQRVALTG